MAAVGHQEENPLSKICEATAAVSAGRSVRRARVSGSVYVWSHRLWLCRLPCDLRCLDGMWEDLLVQENMISQLAKDMAQDLSVSPNSKKIQIFRREVPEVRRTEWGLTTKFFLILKFQNTASKTLQISGFLASSHLIVINFNLIRLLNKNNH
jgi:hypothetical protein